MLKPSLLATCYQVNAQDALCMLDSTVTVGH